MSTATSTARIGILNGSFRPNGNGHGITRWIAERLNSTIAASGSETNMSTSILDYSTTPSLPQGPFVSDVMPAKVKSSVQYPDERIQKWSETILALSALIVITPQYNWGYPGELKNAIDQLFHEWHGLPIIILSYGGKQGGAKAHAQLQQVLAGGVDANVISNGEVAIKLPFKEYIVGDARVGNGNAGDVFLAEYEEVVDELLIKIVKAAQTGRAPASSSA
ncbi:hypothetical protein EMMF5_003679 [Cystobasidiomycetes sp. EMM_F5]